mgnify:CR=1 FL=1|jgi:glycosyltransferase involved in cell wall biosynthesis
MGFYYTEMQEKSNGGTEQVSRQLQSLLPTDLLEDFQIIPSRVTHLNDDKIRIYHLHDLPEDPETNHLKEKTSQDRFHKIVFCGNWQYNSFLSKLNIQPTNKLIVLDTPIVPFTEKEIIDAKPNDGKIRLVYTSTPQRGLSLLVPVFVELAKKYPNIHLDVFSSFKIYGWEEMDKQYEPLYETCRQHPQIVYHGYAANEEVRKTVAAADIFSYPSIWMECNSRSLIEAMSSGCICVHPNLAGLSDTSGNLTEMYQFHADQQLHARMFYEKLENAILAIQNKNFPESKLQLQKGYANYRYNANRIADQWKDMLEELLSIYPNPENRNIPKMMFSYSTTNRR